MVRGLRQPCLRAAAVSRPGADAFNPTDPSLGPNAPPGRGLCTSLARRTLNPRRRQAGEGHGFCYSV
eukprot:7265964-Alexandrium_andersonii.AAC.1